MYRSSVFLRTSGWLTQKFGLYSAQPDLRVKWDIRLIREKFQLKYGGHSYYYNVS
jgi:hypothetical protein